MDILEEAMKVFDIEINNLLNVEKMLDKNFEKLVYAIHDCNGRVIITGIGKSGHIARKISATMASLGTPSYFLHPSEGLHGDLGIVTADDVVIAVSNSGETDEILNMISSIKTIGALLVSVTGKSNSALAENSDLSIVLPVLREASPYNLAPTSSTTALLVFGDALAVVLSKTKKFNIDDFALFHPYGTLGKRLLLKVKDIMYKGENNPFILENSTIKDAIFVMSSKGLGAVSIIDADAKLLGILTDGDLRRSIEKNLSNDIFDIKVLDFMNKNPYVINENKLAVDAFLLMENSQKKLLVLPVINDKGELTGMIRLHDIIKAGIKG